jgi:hypothetical protein
MSRWENKKERGEGKGRKQLQVQNIDISKNKLQHPEVYLTLLKPNSEKRSDCVENFGVACLIIYIMYHFILYFVEPY